MAAYGIQNVSNCQYDLRVKRLGQIYKNQGVWSVMIVMSTPLTTIILNMSVYTIFA